MVVLFEVQLQVIDFTLIALIKLHTKQHYNQQSNFSLKLLLV